MPNCFFILRKNSEKISSAIVVVCGASITAFAKRIYKKRIVQAGHHPLGVVSATLIGDDFNVKKCSRDAGVRL